MTRGLSSWSRAVAPEPARMAGWTGLAIAGEKLHWARVHRQERGIGMALRVAGEGWAWS